MRVRVRVRACVCVCVCACARVRARVHVHVCTWEEGGARIMDQKSTGGNPPPPPQKKGYQIFKYAVIIYHLKRNIVQNTNVDIRHAEQKLPVRRKYNLVDNNMYIFLLKVKVAGGTATGGTATGGTATGVLLQAF